MNASAGFEHWNANAPDSTCPWCASETRCQCGAFDFEADTFTPARQAGDMGLVHAVRCECERCTGRSPER